MSNGSGRQTLFDELSNPNHPLRQREWNTFLQRREQLLDDILAKLQLAGMNLDQGRAPGEPTATQQIDFQAIEEALRREGMLSSMESVKPEAMRERDHQQMIGAAQVYGITEPESIPVGELEQMLESARTQRRQDKEETGIDPFSFITKPGEESALIRAAHGAIAVGGSDALLRTAETLPFIGKWMSSREEVQQLNRYIGAIREASTGGLSEQELIGFQVGEAVTGLAGYIVPGIAAWRLSGAILGGMGMAVPAAARVGHLTGRTTVDPRTGAVLQEVAGRTRNFGTIAKRSLQGGLAGFMLESGGDGPIEEKVMNVGFGFALGTAFEIGGPVAVGTFGGLAGGIVGSQTDIENGTIIGAAGGVATALGGHRLYRMFARQHGLNQRKVGQWFDAEEPGFGGRNPRYGPVIDVEMPTLPLNRRLLMAGDPPVRGTDIAPGGPSAPRGSLPDISTTTRELERFSYRGTRNLFMGSNQRPDELIENWTTIREQGTGALREGESFVNAIELDNSGRMLPGMRHVYEVEARFNNAFVLTPESAPLFRQHVEGAHNLEEIQRRLTDRGYDGLAIQGIDDLITQVGPDVVQQQLGLPSDVLQDRVVAFGSPNQVRFSRPIVDGELLEDAFSQFGSNAGRQVAAIQTATFSREARKQLRPFIVGEARDLAPPPPQWLSEVRGVPFIASEGATSPLVPQGTTRAVLQHHPETGPRVVLLDEDQVAIASMPVRDMDDGVATLQRLGFDHVEPNSIGEAVELANVMSRAETAINNNWLDRLTQGGSFRDADLIPIAYADNPGRLTVFRGTENPLDLRDEITQRIHLYDPDFDPAKNLHFFEEPIGTFHAIVGPEELFTPQMKKQFLEFGVFSGMQARSSEGLAVRINSVWREKSGRERVSISPLFSDVKATVPLGYVLPENFSTTLPIPGNVWNKFKKFAVKEFNVEAQAAGIAPATDITDTRLLTLIDRYVEDFAESSGIKSEYEISRMAQSLDVNLAQEYRSQLLETPDGQIMDAISRDAADELTKATLQGKTLLPDIFDMAQVKGFIWEPPWHGRWGQLVDEKANTVIPFRDVDSAKAFLQNFHRGASEIGPDGMELMAAGSMFPGTHASRGPSGVEFVSYADEVRAHENNALRLGEAVDELEKNVEQFAELMDIADQASASAAQTPSEPPPTPRGPFRVEAPSGGTPPPPPPPPGEPPVSGLVPSDPGGLRQRAEEAITRRPPTTLTGKPFQGAEWDRTKAMLNQIERTFKNNPEYLLDLASAMDASHVKMLAPMRTFAARLDNELRSFGIDQPTLWRDVDGFLQDKIVATNWSIPWIREKNEIIRVFKRAHRRGQLILDESENLVRTGPLYDVMTADPTMMVDPATGLDARTALMDKYEFTPEQRFAVEELRDFMNRLHAEGAAVDDLGFVFDYLPRLRFFHDVHGTEKAWAEWHKLLPDNLKWFARYAREGNLEHYYKDVGRILDTYIRGLAFEKHAMGSFMRVKETWTNEQIPPKLKIFMENWLFTARHGHPPGHDGVVQGITGTINRTAKAVTDVTGVQTPRVTEGEVLNAFGGIQTIWYRSWLGDRPATIIREILQPFLNAPKIGIGSVVRGYTGYIGNMETRIKWNQRAEKYGWAEPNRNAVVNAEFFTGEIRTSEGVSQMSPGAMLARENLASVMDRFHDLLPTKLRNGIEGNPILDPLYLYRKLATNPGRVISGNVAFEKAERAIAAFRLGEFDWDALMRQSDAAYHHQSLQKEFAEAMRDGNYEAAARIMGNEGAKTQFMFGIAEQSEAIRNAGLTGRGVMMFGNFSNQLGWWTAENIKHRHGLERLKFIGTLAGLAAIPELIANKTGWRDMSRFNWLRSITFGGGPLVDPMIMSIPASTGIRKQLLGESLSPEEQLAVARFRDLWGNLVTHPYGGRQRTIEGYYQALTSQEPNEAFWRMTLTGNPRSEAPRRGLENFGEVLQETFNTPESFQTPLVAPPVRGDRTNISEAEWERFIQMLDSISELPGGGSRE